MKEFTTIPIHSQILNFLVSVDGDGDGDCDGDDGDGDDDVDYDGDSWRSSDCGDGCSVMMMMILMCAESDNGEWW